MSTPHPQTVRRSVAAIGSVEAPFPAGWFDRLMDWIDRQPGPNALWCASLLVVQLAYMMAMLWVNGRVPVGRVDFSLVFIVAVIPYLLWSRFHLDRVAGAALDAFRPDVALESPALRLVLTAMVPLSVACFVLPLRGMHARIAAEKYRVLAEAGVRFEHALARLHERVDRGDLTDAEKMNHQITSLVAERQALERVSTWPWEKTTVTGFVTALLLPALLWAAQRLLSRFGL